MKDKKELKQLKSRLGALDEKLAELNAAELEEVIGGINTTQVNNYQTNNIDLGESQTYSTQAKRDGKPDTNNI